jgi:hypothetical protein
MTHIKLDQPIDFSGLNQTIAWLAGVESLPPCEVVVGVHEGWTATEEPGVYWKEMTAEELDHA